MDPSIDNDCRFSQYNVRDEIFSMAKKYQEKKSIQQDVILNGIKKLLGELDSFPIFKTIRDDIQKTIRKLECLDDLPLNLAVIGEFSSGKSTLINAMLGGNELLPVNISETTALISKIEYALYPKMTIIYKNGDEKKMDINDYSDLVDENSNTEKIEGVKYVSVTERYAPLKKITIYDTPGLNSKFQRHEESTLNHINDVEVVFWVFRATKIRSGTEMSYLEKIRNRGCKVYAIINLIDRLRGFGKDEERFQKEYQRTVNKLDDIKHHFEKVLPISAKLANDGIQKHDQSLFEASQFESVKNVIEVELCNKADAIKRDHFKNILSLYTGIPDAINDFFCSIIKNHNKGASKFLSTLDTMAKEFENYNIQSEMPHDDNDTLAPWE